MEHIISFLSGGVPGGILVLLLLLLIVNLAFSFLKSSKLFSKEQSKKNRRTYSFALLLVYIGIWLATQPPKPQIRVVVMPAISSDSSFQAEAQAFELAELFRYSAPEMLKPKYLLHRWTWLYETINADSVDFFAQWLLTAQALHPGILIQPYLQKGSVSCSVVSGGDSLYFSASTPQNLLIKIKKNTGLFKKNSVVPNVHLQYLPLRLLMLQKKYDTVIASAAADTSFEIMQLIAEAYVHKGLLRPIDREKAKYMKIENPDFQQARKYYSKIIRAGTDTPETAYWLGRMAIYDQTYTQAEVFLKKAFVEDPSNARILLQLSYLHPDRLKEFGYKSRIDILKRAVALDPGFREGVFQLAQEYYSSGTGTSAGTGTNRARQTIETFLKISRDDLNILSLLASIELKLGYYDKAFHLYSKIAVRTPHNSNAWYNLGVVYFMKKEYQKALHNFLKAIAIDQNRDAYLYAGITYRMLGDNKRALHYYRERIRRKSGDDDKWAKEAMRGIRKILSDTTKKNEN